MKQMLKRLTSIALLATLGTGMAQAAEDDALAVSLSYNHDAFFGPNPFLGVTYDTGTGVDLTFYGIVWGAGTGENWGNWTEFGVGVGFELMDGDLYVNPQIGILSGTLLSSGAAQSDGIVGDGFVPNLTMNYDTEGWEGQLYFGWYMDLQDATAEGQSTNEYIHYWLNGGKKFGDYFSVGLHFEELRLSGGSNVSSLDGYQWIGPYFQVANDTAGLRFSFGGDLTDDDDSFSQSDFYKLQFFFNF